MIDLELEIDECTIILCGHELTLLMDLVVTFDTSKRILRIEQIVDRSAGTRLRSHAEVCPVQSKALYDALFAYLTTSAGIQSCMDEAIEQFYLDQPRRRPSLYERLTQRDFI